MLSKAKVMPACKQEEEKDGQTDGQKGGRGEEQNELVNQGKTQN